MNRYNEHYRPLARSRCLYSNVLGYVSHHQHIAEARYPLKYCRLLLSLNPSLSSSKAPHEINMAQSIQHPYQSQTHENCLPPLHCDQGPAGISVPARQKEVSALLLGFGRHRPKTIPADCGIDRTTAKGKLSLSFELRTSSV